MLQAIHKLTGKPVSAYQLVKDISWGGRSNDVFLAPYHEIGNWQELEQRGIAEVEVSFIKHHLRNGSPVIDHFRIKTEGAIENPDNESEEHRLAKQVIYQKLWDDEILLINFGGKRIGELAPLVDVRIERGIHPKRVDVLATFKDEHPSLGRGIAFEIQISPQSEEKTIDRTLDRAAQGYSVVWLWGRELQNFNNQVKVIPFVEALRLYQATLESQARFFLGDIGQQAEVKIWSFKKDLLNVYAEAQHLHTQLADQTKQFKDELRKQATYHETEHIARTLATMQSKITEAVSSTATNEYISESIHRLVDNKAQTAIGQILPTLVQEAVEKHTQAAISKFLSEREFLSDDLHKSILASVQNAVNSMAFADDVKSRMVMCFPCKRCEKLVPAGMVNWMHLPDTGEFRSSLCYPCFSNKGGQKSR